MRFSLASVAERSWPAESFGQHRNGWATPVLIREVVADLLRARAEPHRWEGDVAVLGTPAADLAEDGEAESGTRSDPTRTGSTTSGRWDGRS